MNLSEAKKLKIGDVVELRCYGGEYEITGVSEFTELNKIVLHFQSYNWIFRHKEINKVIKIST